MNIVEIYKKFPSEATCISHLERVRWNDKPTCPYCKSHKQTPLKSKTVRYHCNNCNTSYSVTVGTIFHNSKLDLQKWFLALSLILNAKKGISARQLGRDLNVTKDTAWYIGMRIRKAMSKDAELLRGIVEMDETYIGGKPRYHDKNNARGRGTNKTPVVGMIERNGNVKAFVSDKVDSKRLESLVRRNIDKDNSVLVTDQFPAYRRMNKILPHISVDHSKTYVDGMAHTNNAESFWALLKRGIIGQYHKVSKRYLPLYINEFSFRFNNRKIDNDLFFSNTILRTVGA